ncbi:MAG: Rne/Rng family ribonuclease [Bifidobacteriaceae bacterium]|nr:Rne/Rng family ribonuclease [Bifidobacteriaceae bacterium]
MPEDGTQPESTPVKPRRRGGRRVVRQAGAAGAKLPVTVDESKAAKVSEVTTPSDSNPSDSKKADKTVASSSESSGTTSSRTRARKPRTSSARSAGTRSTRSAAQGTKTASKAADSTPDVSQETASDAASTSQDTDRQRRVDALASELFSDPGIASGRPKKSTASRRSTRTVHEATTDVAAEASSQHARPMTSLLFQEPVLPAASAEQNDASRGASENSDASEKESGEDSRTSSRKRRQTKTRTRSERSERSERGERASRNEDAERTDNASDEEPTNSRKRSRNRRLNAQERRAAAEVEQIEEDMEYDDVPFTAIESGKTGDAEADDTSDSSSRYEGNDSDSDDSDERGNSRRRRRRRRGSHEDEEETSSRGDRRSGDRRDHEEDDEEDDAPVTRRRRRRRKSEDEDARPSSSSRGRSRKQQYIDEITDIEGSTRLEAKRQRRRDNRRDRSRQTLITEQDFLARRENVDRQMVVREKDRHTQISVIEDDILVEHYVSDIQEVSTVGNIYLGRVQNVLPSMEAAFVDIGKPRNGVLYAGEVNWDSARLEGHPRRIELAYHSGDPVLVQVTKDPIGHKGARLTSQVTLAGRFIVLVPSGAMTGVSRKLPERERTRLKKIVQAIAPKDMGIIIRTAAEGASEEAITKDCENLVHQWESITEKIEQYKDAHKPKLLKGEPDVAIRVVRDIFNDDFRTLAVQGDGVYERIKDYLEQMAPDLMDKLTKWDPADHQGKDVFDQWQIDGQLRKGMERQVYLPSGGSLVIDRTEAMTTIDVNTGRFIGKGKSLEETVTRCNLEAAEEIVRQLRLRDIGGMVMIDFVDMVLEANRDLVLRRLVECLARDRTKHQVAEVTSLGLVQMTRKRVGQGLVEAFSEECPTCHGRGFILHDEPTVSSTSDDPYAVKGGDPFIDGKKHRRSGSSSASDRSEQRETRESHEDRASRGNRDRDKDRDRESHEELEKDNAPKGSTAEVKAKLAAIAAAASRHEEEEEEANVEQNSSQNSANNESQSVGV